MISNALKYSPADAEVKVEVTRCQQGKRNEVVVAVHDKGRESLKKIKRTSSSALIVPIMSAIK
nr:ATP-binding protein [Ktedonobacter racemifer]